MRLSPLDIRKQEFARKMRGYDADEVQAFLNMVSQEWEDMLDAMRRLEQQVAAAEQRLSHYQRVEEALQETLRVTRETNQQSLDVARQKAESILAEAQRQAEEIKRAAERQRVSMRQEVSNLFQRQDEIVIRLRSFLMSEMEMLRRFEDSVQADEAPRRAEAPDEAAGSEYLGRLFAPEAPADAAPARPAPAPVFAGPPPAAPVFAGPRPEDQERFYVPESNLVPAAAEPPPSADERAGGHKWVVKPVFSAAPPPLDETDEASDPEGAPDLHEEDLASADEHERIRRILKDLE